MRLLLRVSDGRAYFLEDPRLSAVRGIICLSLVGWLACTGLGLTMNICLAVMCYLLVFAEPVVLFVSGEAFAGAGTPVRIIGAVSLMSSIAAAPVSVVLNLLLDGPFGAVGAGVALLATVLCIGLWCARDVRSSFVRPRDLARMAVSNAVAVAVSAGYTWLLATAFSAGPGVIAIAGLLVYCAVDIAVAVALRDDTALMLVGKARAVLRRGWALFHRASCLPVPYDVGGISMWCGYLVRLSGIMVAMIGAPHGRTAFQA